MKVYRVSPEFLQAKEFVTNLPQTFNQNGLVIHNRRNIIKKVDTNDGTFVVKNFKGMYLFNRIAYSLFRKSKAARSYIHSGILNAHGIQTPPHVAWLDCYAFGFLTQSYFVSVYSPYETLEKVIQYYNIYNPGDKRSLLHHVAAFALHLHQLGIYHEDFSLGNILVIRAPGKYQFALVDLNRIKFKKKINYDQGLRNFITLRASRDDVDTVIREYATLSGQAPESAVELFWQYEHRKMSLRRFRRRIRRYTVKPVENFFNKRHL